MDLDEVPWTAPPEREEAGFPNVVGAVALHAAIDTLTGIGWPALAGHERHVGLMLADPASPFGYVAADKRTLRHPGWPNVGPGSTY